MAISTAAAILGAGALSAGVGAYSASQAAQAQQNAADQSAALQREMFERQTALQEPFRQGGLSAQNQLLTLLGLRVPTGEGAVAGLSVDPNSPDFGSAARSFSMADFKADPGYAFRMSEGMKALDRSAAARGGLLSGAALKGASRFGQDLASGEYTNAFNRYQTERSARINPLLSLLGAGQTSANTLTNAAGNLGQGLGQAAVASGNAQASQYMNTSNALTSALNQGVNMYAQLPYLNAQTAYMNKLAGIG
jgi:hypothetical protein